MQGRWVMRRPGIAPGRSWSPRCPCEADPGMGPPTRVCARAATGFPAAGVERSSGRSLSTAPGVGLEPTTYGLTVRRSAN
jgi:hypothetical protein